MGSSNSKSSAKKDLYKPHKPINSRSKGSLKTLRHSGDHNLLKLLKIFNTSSFNTNSNEFKILTKRSKSLPNEFFSGELYKIEEVEPGFCAPSMTEITVSFDSRTLNLHSLTKEYQKIYKEKDAISLLYFVAKAGNVMQSRLDYFPELKLKNIYIDDNGLKLENPYIYDEYIHYILQVSYFFTLLFFILKLEYCQNQRII